MRTKSGPLPVVLATALLGLAAEARAEPYLAARNGYKCSECHVSRTGGGMRNDFGRVYSLTQLPTWTVSAEDLRAVTPDSLSDALPESTLMTGRLSEYVAVGANFRLAHIARWSNVDDDASTSFGITEGNLYLQLDPIPGLLTLYLDETVAPGGAAAREAFALVQGLPLDSYVKFGRIMLPYGLRLWDDEAFVRQVTGFNYGVQDLGLEVGVEPGPLSLVAAISNGSGGTSDDNKDKQVSAVAQIVFRHWRLGASFSWNSSPNNTRLSYGVFAALNVGRFTALAEFDQVVDAGRGRGATLEATTRQRMAYAELDVLVYDGVNLKGTFDWIDDQEVRSDERTRYGVGVEWFVTQYTQARVLYRFREEPSANINDNDRELLVELHVFF